MKNILILVFLALIFSSCSDKQKQEKITRLDQLHDKRISVITGTAADIATRKQFPGAEIRDFYATTDAAYNVNIGKTDAFIFDEVVLENIVKEYPSLSLLDEPVDKAAIAIAFPQNRIVLLEKVNVILKQLTKNGTLQILKEKWINPGYTTVPELPDRNQKYTLYSTSPHSGYNMIPDTTNQNTSDKKDVLRIGVCAQFPPMMFVYNNQITGFDMDLAIRIANLLGKEIEIIDMSFDSLILSLQAEKIDFAISNFDITEQRKKFVKFSDPYLIQDISALVKK
ncbi:MAG: transporter substrate-binding domain-containing protein [Bacteroidota bacterium]